MNIQYLLIYLYLDIVYMVNHSAFQIFLCFYLVFELLYLYVFCIVILQCTVLCTHCG